MLNVLSNLHPKVRWSALAGLIVAAATFLGLPLSGDQASAAVAVLMAVVGWLVPSGDHGVAPQGVDDGAAVDAK